MNMNRSIVVAPVVELCFLLYHLSRFDFNADLQPNCLCIMHDR